MGSFEESLSFSSLQGHLWASRSGLGTESIPGRRAWNRPDGGLLLRVRDQEGGGRQSQGRVKSQLVTDLRPPLALPWLPKPAAPPGRQRQPWPQAQPLSPARLLTEGVFRKRRGGGRARHRLGHRALPMGGGMECAG